MLLTQKADMPMTLTTTVIYTINIINKNSLKYSAVKNVLPTFKRLLQVAIK
jgi:hypothetical protein